ncbi:MAG TPA: oligopeptide transporter, OPT family [Candidatus Babeliales bacterium]|nr:oligopeptide transporter, OPT family [Candidatus Babeliales bacterium]
MERRVELTLRGFVLGAAITLVFTAANVYLGLKVGLTFASSIPAAVISMAVLRAFRNATIYENNIVQTIASAAGTLSAVIFVLPGLVMIGWWNGFPFGESFAICAIGGVLGVMYSVPLRRALVTGSDLPYPEGVAAAEVLKVGTASRSAAQRNRAGLLALVLGTVASAGFALVVATRVFAGGLAGYFRIGNATTGLGFSLSLALVGAGQLIGISVGLAIFAGLLIAWAIATPVLTALHPAAGAAADVATAVWSHQVRFIGAGAIGVAALWALGRLARPVALGVSSALAASRHRRQSQVQLPRSERDLPIGIVAIVSLACLIPLAVLFWSFLGGSGLAPVAGPMTAAAVIYVVIAGFFVAAACGYMAGLIGSSNSPVSGLAILSVIGAALIVLAVGNGLAHSGALPMIAYALFVTAVLLCVATISNDNLQDLKTGQLVDATPWCQQVALVAGVVAGALVIPPILDLLNRAYGFAGAAVTHATVAQPLPAPQATLISALAKGVISGQLDWHLIGTGALVGAAIVATDEILRKTTRFALPPLAVGLGIYLPPSTTAPVVLGAVLGWAYNRWTTSQPQPDRARQLGVLVASGLIVGESLFGVLLAGLIVFSGNASPLGLAGDAFAPVANALGALAFVLALAALFGWLRRLSRLSGQPAGDEGTILT